MTKGAGKYKGEEVRNLEEKVHVVRSNFWGFFAKIAKNLAIFAILRD